MADLELNIKKLAKLAGQSFALREYAFDPEENVFPSSALVKGVMNEKRANKLSYSDVIRNDHFSTDYIKISKAIDTIKNMQHETLQKLSRRFFITRFNFHNLL